MSFRTILAVILFPIERLITLIKGSPERPIEIDPYDGFQTAEGVILRGRVLAVMPRVQAKETDGRLRNSINFLRQFLTDERPGLPVEVVGQGVRGVTDDDGYFQLRLENGSGIYEQSYMVSVAGVEVEIPVYAATAEAPFSVISDIDDTVMHTGAYSLLLNLWNSITGNPLTRRVFPDAVALLKQLHAKGCPIFYVSSSPWNIHRYLKLVFERARLPEGPLFLRDLGLSKSKLLSSAHGSHKTGAIEEILAARPWARFWLIGDTGQHDAEIYGKIARMYPGRIDRIILRQATETLRKKTLQALEDMRKAGLKVEVVLSYEQVDL